MNIDIKILPFDIAYFLPKENIVTDSPVEDIISKNIKEISGSEIRKHLKNNTDIPSYLVRPIVKKILTEEYDKREEYVFEETKLICTKSKESMFNNKSIAQIHSPF